MTTDQLLDTFDVCCGSDSPSTTATNNSINFCDKSIEATSGPALALEFFKKRRELLFFSTRKNALITTQSSREIMRFQPSKLVDASIIKQRYFNETGSYFPTKLTVH